MYKISITPDEITALPKGAFGGSITVIDKLGPEFDRAIRYLRNQRLIGFDTETKPVFTPDHHHHLTALLQLSGPSKAFLFRVKDIGMPKKLCSLLASPNVIKVGAAVGDDIRGLQNYYRFSPASFVDLQSIGWEYGIRDKSVKKMAAIILGIHISKSQQMSNWEAEVLSEAQKSYAATDAWVCREMYLKLMASERNPLTQEQLNPHPENQQ